MRKSIYTICLILLVSVPMVSAQNTHSIQRSRKTPSVKVMLLGTVHLASPSNDVNSRPIPEVLAPEQQRELAAIRDALAQFNPTKIAVEVGKKYQEALDSLYKAYITGQMDSSFAVGGFDSKKGEVYQLGFKLAKRLGHERVWAVDHQMGMNFTKVLRYAQKHDTLFIHYFRNFEGVTKVDSLLKYGTLQQMYRFLNRRQTVHKYRTPYARMATVAEDTSYVGTDVIAQYHKRNLRIFANIEEIAKPGDRILVIFGAGHMPFLRPLVKASPRMKFITPLKYL